jgi:hypothetical protein
VLGIQAITTGESLSGPPRQVNMCSVLINMGLRKYGVENGDGGCKSGCSV